MAKKKIGLALGGGAARGLAHIGVLEVLEREGIPIDLVAGTSAGALFGALHAAGVPARKIKDYVLSFGWAHRARLVDLTLPRTGFISGDRIMDEMKNMMGGDRRFAELDKPLACIACDIITGEEVVMTRGSVAEAVRASISIPVVFAAVKRKGRYLIDGGLINLVPVNIARAMGADFVIAVNVLPRHAQKVKPKLKESAKNAGESEPRPSILTIVLNTIDIANSYRVETSLSGADVVIEPRTVGFGAADFHNAARLILQGEMAAIDAVLAIKRQMAQW